MEGYAFHAARTRRSGLKLAEKAKPFRKAGGEAQCGTVFVRYLGQLRPEVGPADGEGRHEACPYVVIELRKV